MVSAIRDHVMALACIRHGLPSAHGRGMDLLPNSITERLLRSLVRELSSDELWRALGIAVEGLGAEVNSTDRSLVPALPLTSRKSPLKLPSRHVVVSPRPRGAISRARAYYGSTSSVGCEIRREIHHYRASMTPPEPVRDIVQMLPYCSTSDIVIPAVGADHPPMCEGEAPMEMLDSEGVADGWRESASSRCAHRQLYPYLVRSLFAPIKAGIRSGGLFVGVIPPECTRHATGDRGSLCEGSCARQVKRL